MAAPRGRARLLGALRRASERALRPTRRGRREVHADYPGDFAGVVHPEYAPDPDGDPDPGEIVWTWVPYEEDAERGKDRPVLIVGRDQGWLLALMLSTVDHDAQPRHGDQTWVDIGSGDWDARRRPSEVRVDRIVRVDPRAVRREGAVLDLPRFELVTGSLAEARGW